jgi:hypothetical protein
MAHNLSIKTLGASVREVREDPQLGRSPEERLNNLDRARRIARALNIGSFVVAAWALFYPRPYMAMFLVLIALPWVALWLCWKYPGSFAVDDPGRNSIREDLTALLVMPGFILAFRALFDVHLIDPTKLIAPTVAGLVFMVFCIAWIAPAYRKQVGKFILMSLLLPHILQALLRSPTHCSTATTPTGIGWRSWTSIALPARAPRNTSKCERGALTQVVMRSKFVEISIGRQTWGRLSA